MNILGICCAAVSGFCPGIAEWWPKTGVLCVPLECLCVLLEYIVCKSDICKNRI